MSCLIRNKDYGRPFNIGVTKKNVRHDDTVNDWLKKPTFPTVMTTMDVYRMRMKRIHARL